jgi:hypothetical protein
VWTQQRGGYQNGEQDRPDTAIKNHPAKRFIDALLDKHAKSLYEGLEHSIQKRLFVMKNTADSTDNFLKSVLASE